MTVLLVRHGHADGPAQQLPGPPPGPPLSPLGVRQAGRLASRLRLVSQIFTSPYRRTAQTAEVIAQAARAPLETDEALSEVPFGDWAGREVAALAAEPAWIDFNVLRTVTPIGSAGLMIDVQARALGWLARVAAAHRDRTVAAVSHADVIRAIVAGCAGMSLDLSLRLAIGVASISEIHIAPGVLRVERVNDTAHLEDLS